MTKRHMIYRGSPSLHLQHMYTFVCAFLCVHCVYVHKWLKSCYAHFVYEHTSSLCIGIHAHVYTSTVLCVRPANSHGKTMSLTILV